MNRSLDKNKFESVINIVFNILKVGVIILYVMIGLFVLLSIIFPFIPKTLLDFDLSNLEHVNIQTGSILYDMSGIITFTGIVNLKWLLSLLFIVVTINLGFFQYILILLKNILIDVQQKTPFSIKNITRLKYMGIAYLVSSIVLSFVNGSLFSVIINTFDIFEANVNFSIDFQSVFMGTLILILAYVFEYGALLQEDSDMTV